MKTEIDWQQLCITESINSCTNKRPNKPFSFVQIVCVSCANNRCSSNITYHSFFPTTMDPTLIWSHANTLLILINNYFMRIWNSLRGVGFRSPRSNKNPTFVDIYKFIKSLKMCFFCVTQKRTLKYGLSRELSFLLKLDKNMYATSRYYVSIVFWNVHSGNTHFQADSQGTWHVAK